MAVNRFDRPILSTYVSLYVPIPFQELYALGKEYKAQVDAAYEELDNVNRMYGQFRSPSSVDTKNFYDITLGKYKDLIDAAAANPELMKSGQFRSQLMQRDASLDYAAINMLRESADNLRKGEEMRAKMMAEGTYNPNWDTANIPEYDTLGRNAVFQDITPIKWMNANQLSNAYFDNLQPTELGSVWKDGVKYNRSGITYNTLLGISEARFNDLVATPQGRMYYNDFLKRYNGDAEAAKEAFVTMIADSQRDRIRVKDDLDAAQFQRSNSSRGRSSGGSGSGNNDDRLLTRQERMSWDLNSVAQRAYGSKNPRLQAAYSQLNTLNKPILDAANQAKAEYERTGDKKYVDIYNQLMQEAATNEYNVTQASLNQMFRDKFKEVAGFGLEDDPESHENYSREGYLRGVNASLNELKSVTSLRDEDPLFTLLGGVPNAYTTEYGAKVNSYHFNNSSDFVMPDEVFSTFTNTQLPKVYDDDMSRDEVTLHAALSGGKFKDVEFIPDSGRNTVQSGNNKLIAGVLRVPKSEVDKVVDDVDDMSVEQGVSRIRLIPKDSEESTEFYEFQVYRILPDDNIAEYWIPVDALDHNAPAHGGIGGASQTKDQMHTIEESSINRN